jgi:two-component system LytT family sensor kinase
MKIRFLVFLFYIFSAGIYHRALAQKVNMPPFGNMIYFGGTVTEAMRAEHITAQGIGVRDTDVDGLFKRWLLKDVTLSAILLGVKLNPKLTNYELSPVKSFSKSYTAFRISDQSDAILIALGITNDNVNDYRYHVIVNDSAEVVHWSKIPKLDKNYGATKPYGFIGKFNYPGKRALVEVVNINNYQIRDGVLFDWRKNVKPVTININVHGSPFKGDITKVAHPSQFWSKKGPFEIKHDPVTNELTEIKFVQDSLTGIELILREHPTIPYNVSIVRADNNTFDFFSGAEGDILQSDSRLHRETNIQSIMAEGDMLQSDFTFNLLPHNPGKYEIVIRPQIAGGVDIEGQTLRIPVIILPHPVLEKSALLKQLVPYLIAAIVVIGLLFWLYRRRSNIKLAKSVQAKQTVTLKLRAIRAQLNPHFMYNALTSIQNLVNKNDMGGANHYLSRFANLTRKVLDTSEHDLISLEDEIKILDDYLQMEQLRFNFQYELKVVDGINIANTEVPAMLLQPFIENAVKHGVANLREKGIIEVLVNQAGNDLAFSVTDNGVGFRQKTEEGPYNPFGLKLSEERIQLLNEVYKSQPVRLAIKSDEKGTTVTITLNNWIS